VCIHGACGEKHPFTSCFLYLQGHFIRAMARVAKNIPSLQFFYFYFYFFSSGAFYPGHGAGGGEAGRGRRCRRL